jgi:hypothetical protein
MLSVSQPSLVQIDVMASEIYNSVDIKVDARNAFSSSFSSMATECFSTRASGFKARRKEAVFASSSYENA